MRYTLTIFIAAIFSTAYCQIDSNVTYTRDSIFYLRGLSIASVNPVDTLIKMDTVPIIMLASDTEACKSLPISTIYFSSPMPRAQRDHHDVYWLYGFQVYQVWLRKAGTYRIGFLMGYLPKDEEYSVFVKNLDEDKNELSKHIVPWIIKRI